MPLPDFTTPPQFLEVPAYPLVQPCFNGLPGPYAFGGKIFWIFCEDSSASANSAQLVAYSNTSSTGSQPSTRIAPGSPINMAGQNIFTVTFPGSGSTLYVTYRDKATHTIHFVTFDMSSSTWGAPNDSSVVGDQIHAVCYGFQLSSGDFQIIYTADTSSPDQVATTIWNGVSWSSPVNLTASGTSLTLATAQLLPSDKIGFWYYDSTNIFYGYCNGGSLLGSTTVTTKAGLLTSEGIYSYYDPVSDTAAFSCVRIPSSPARELDILLTSPAASTTTSVVTVFNDVSNDHGYLATTLAGNAAGDTFYLNAVAHTDVQLHIFGSSSLASGWTASPAVFYDQVSNEPSPAPSGPEVLPVYSTFLNGTDYAVTCGFLCAVSPDPPFCGVMAAMIPASVTPIVPACNNPPSGVVGIVYGPHTLTATGGTPPYTFTITGGALPSGLTLFLATGVISGTPTSSGTFSFTVTVTDSLSATGTVTCSITIGPGISVSCNNPPGATENVFYTHALTTNGGSGTPTFQIIAGNLPLGLTLDGTTGIISGIPTAIGVFPFTVQVIDNSGINSVVCSIAVTTFVTPPVGCFTVLYSWRSFSDPDSLFQWSTRKLTFGFKGYMHCGRIEACWSCKSPLTIDFTAFDGTSPAQIVLPASGNNGNEVAKLYVTPTFNKFQMLTTDFSSPSNMQIYPREFIFWIKQWGSSGPYYPYRMGEEESVKP